MSVSVDLRAALQLMSVWWRAADAMPPVCRSTSLLFPRGSQALRKRSRLLCAPCGQLSLLVLLLLRPCVAQEVTMTEEQLRIQQERQQVGLVVMVTMLSVCLLVVAVVCVLDMLYYQKDKSAED
eukprot:TRINITY_DN52440_c0_g1_i1.p1 TRINITY_DN52440_c0_g1~~TRINITY_DN52440_c0_g1_i1.p1  ORF type:complete len:124 (+),score=24.72 TRINITY_DN52440_c0_g1_i1:42-413(+)